MLTSYSPDKDHVFHCLKLCCGERIFSSIGYLLLCHMPLSGQIFLFCHWFTFLKMIWWLTSKRWCLHPLGPKVCVVPHSSLTKGWHELLWLTQCEVVLPLQLMLLGYKVSPGRECPYCLGKVGLVSAPAGHWSSHLNQTSDMKPLSKVEAEDWAVLFETQVSLFLTVICKVNNCVKTVRNSLISNKNCPGTIMMVFINNEFWGVFLHLDVAF